MLMKESIKLKQQLIVRRASCEYNTLFYAETLTILFPPLTGWY